MERIAALERDLAELQEWNARSRDVAAVEFERLHREWAREREEWALQERIEELTRQRDGLANRLGHASRDVSDERELYKRCLLAAQKGDWRGAIAFLRELGAKHPSSRRLARLIDRVRRENGHRIESAADIGGRCACDGELVLRS